MPKQSSQWLIPVILAVAAGLALWYYWMQVSEPPPESLVMPAEAPAERLPGPVHPVPVDDAVAVEQPNLVPLPSLDESDEYFRLELDNLYGDALDALLVESGLIEKFVATVDNLPRSRVAERIRPLGPVPGAFLAEEAGGDRFRLGAGNHARYDQLVALLAATDLDQAVAVYRRYYPLMQKAYVQLGYPNGYFNDRLVEVIDHLLATPDVDAPLALARPHVLFEYDDPELEALSGGQKILLRMGPEHARTVKQKLRDLRARLVAL